MDEKEIIRRLSTLDLSHESKIRSELRNHLATRFWKIHFWMVGFRYWVGLAIIFLLAIAWTHQFQFPESLPHLQPKATAFANTSHPSQLTSRDISSTLPAAPRPIPTPYAILRGTSSSNGTSPFLTISPPTTPSMTLP